MRKVSNALHNASVDAAESMTKHIRSAAISSGWNPDVANKLTLNYIDKKFSLVVDPAFKAKVHDHEFGTQTSPPSPVLRGILNDHELFGSHVGAAFKKHWKGGKQ